MSFAKAKIALVFDWMTTRGGAEKVNLVLHKMFPDADIFTSIFNAKNFPELEKAKIETSFIQNLPFAKKHHQFYLSLMPYAYELFDLSAYDIVISSSHSCAKGIITKPNTMHVCYCHTPMRYAWDNWQSYIKEYKMNPILKRFGKKRLHKIRIWDRLASERVDYFIANSSTTKERIEKYYRKHSTVIYPSIKTSKYIQSKEKKGYFLAVGRLTPYKKFDLIVETFNEIGLPLKIVGEGILKNDLEKNAKGNIEFLGYIPEKELKILYSECEALIFPQVEDFGLTPLEAMASGRPVIAYKEGGALDTIIENETGIFFNTQTPQSLKEALEKYQQNKSRFRAQKNVEQALKFDQVRFETELKDYLKTKWEKWTNR